VDEQGAGREGCVVGGRREINLNLSIIRSFLYSFVFSYKGMEWAGVATGTRFYTAGKNK